MPNFISIGLFRHTWVAESSKFCHFLDICILWCPLLPFGEIGGIQRKLNAQAQQRTFPYPTTSKLFLYSNAFKAKSCAQIPSFTSLSTSVTSQTWWTQIDKQKTRFWPPWRQLKSEPNQTWHGDREPRARSCISKTWGPTNSFVARGCWNFLGNPSPQLKAPIIL